MNLRTKIITSILMITVMLASIMPISVFAADENALSHKISPATATSTGILVDANKAMAFNGLQASPLSVTTSAGTSILSGAVTIIHDGTPQYNELLEVDITDITNTHYEPLSYQWKRDGTNIDSATSETYIINSQYDIGEEISVEVTSNTLTGSLVSGSVIPQKATPTIDTPTLVSKTTDSITIETVLGQKYAIWDSSTRHRINYTVDGTNDHYVFSGLSANTKYYIYTMVEDSATHNWAQSTPLGVKIVLPLTPVRNIRSITATDTTNGIEQLGATIRVNNSEHIIRLIMPQNATMDAIKIDYFTEDGTTVTGFQSGTVTDFTTDRKPIVEFTISDGATSQKWLAMVTKGIPMAPYQIVKNDVTQYGGSDGSITMSTHYAGYIDYEYSINNGDSWKENENFPNLTAGTYTVQVRVKGDTSGEKYIFAPITITQANPSISNGNRRKSSSSNSNKSDDSVAKPVNTNPVTRKVEEGKSATSIKRSLTRLLTGKPPIAQISNSIAHKLYNQAKTIEKNGEKSVVQVDLTLEEGVDKFAVSFPADILGKIAEDTDSDFVIESGIVSVAFNKSSIEAIKEEGLTGNVSFGIEVIDLETLPKQLKDHIREEGRPVFDFSVKVGNKQVSNFGSGSVRVSIPYELRPRENPESIIVYFVNDKGDLEIVNGHYNEKNGSVEFNTDHFSTYMIGYNEVLFSDVKKESWYEDAVSFISARKIVNGVGNDLFNPEGKLTRSEFTTIMVRYFGFTSNSTTRYTDITNDMWFADYVRIAKANGILPPKYGEVFNGNSAITREEMMYMLYKSLEATDGLDTLKDNGNELSDFKDAGMVSDYAKEASAFLVATDVINSSGDNMIKPTSTPTRAEVAQMLWNMINLSK